MRPVYTSVLYHMYKHILGEKRTFPKRLTLYCYTLFMHWEQIIIFFSETYKWTFPIWVPRTLIPSGRSVPPLHVFPHQWGPAPSQPTAEPVDCEIVSEDSRSYLSAGQRPIRLVAQRNALQSTGCVLLLQTLYD